MSMKKLKHGQPVGRPSLCKKRLYETKTHARKVQSSAQLTSDRPKLYIYKCKKCRGYHLTSKPHPKGRYI